MAKELENYASAPIWQVQQDKQTILAVFLDLRLFILEEKSIYWLLIEAQAGIKIAGKNINNLRYADDTTLMAQVKRNSKAS